MSKIGDFFCEDNGKFSSTRLVVMLWNVSVMAVWIYVSFRSGQMAPIDVGVLAGLGIIQATKVSQKFLENKAG